MKKKKNGIQRLQPETNPSTDEPEEHHQGSRFHIVPEEKSQTGQGLRQEKATDGRGESQNRRKETLGRTALRRHTYRRGGTQEEGQTTGGRRLGRNAVRSHGERILQPHQSHETLPLPTPYSEESLLNRSDAFTERRQSRSWLSLTQPSIRLPSPRKSC